MIVATSTLAPVVTIMLSDRPVTIQSVPPSPQGSASAEGGFLEILDRPGLGRAWEVAVKACAARETAARRRPFVEQLRDDPACLAILDEFRRRMILAAAEWHFWQELAEVFDDR